VEISIRQSRELHFDSRREIIVKPHEAYLRWLYRGGRPNLLARLLNRGSAIAHSAGIWPSRLATLEVLGRRTGNVISFPVVIADHEGERYLVAMLGEDTNWVRNVRAAGGRAVLRHGRREAVRLEEVNPEARPAILRPYLDCAPGARPHIPVDRHAPVEEFEQIAPQIPVFRVTTDQLADDGEG
jgi:deazaflavin-dependent oxidoreductase (nitroreductase family)